MKIFLTQFLWLDVRSTLRAVAVSFARSRLYVLSNSLKDGQVFLPTQGIPLSSSLSPFFGAVYLTPLDDAFAQCDGIFYPRYMDDVVICCGATIIEASKQKLIKQWVNQLALEMRANEFDGCVGCGVLLFKGCAEGCSSASPCVMKR